MMGMRTLFSEAICPHTLAAIGHGVTVPAVCPGFRSEGHWQATWWLKSCHGWKEDIGNFRQVTINHVPGQITVHQEVELKDQVYQRYELEVHYASGVLPVLTYYYGQVNIKRGGKVDTSGRGSYDGSFEHG